MNHIDLLIPWLSGTPLVGAFSLHGCSTTEEPCQHDHQMGHKHFLVLHTGHVTGF